MMELSDRRGFNGLVDLLRVPERFLEVIDADRLGKLPGHVDKVITLPPNVLLNAIGYLDLKGCRLVTSGVTVIKGLNSELSFLHSDLTPNFPADTPMVESAYTLNLEAITLGTSPTHYNVGINGLGNNAVADWYATNFISGKAARVLNLQNFLANFCAMIDSTTTGFPGGGTTDGFSFGGSFGTLGFNNSIFVNNNIGSTAIKLDADTVINRRIKLFSSSFIIPTLTSGIVVPETVNTPVEGYILDTLNFSGGGTYLGGVSYLNDKSRFFECRGVTNTARLGSFFWNNNAQVTNIPLLNTFYKVVGTSIASASNQRFQVTDNRLTYISQFQGNFYASITLSAIAGNNNVLSFKVYKNGQPIEESLQKITTSAAGKADNAVIQVPFPLQFGDYLELWVANDSNANVTITDIVSSVRQAA